MMTVDQYIKSCKHILRKINHLEDDFRAIFHDDTLYDDTLYDEWTSQIDWLVNNLLTFLLKCTTKRQALQITAISKRFNKHRVMLEGLGVTFP